MPDPAAHVDTSTKAADGTTRTGLRDNAIAGLALALTVAAGVCEAAGASQVVRFVVSGLALAAVAAVVGQAIEAVGERVGPSATGLLQSTLGNLPELFVGLFALHRGLVGVVRAALAGSILGNAVLVLGLAFVAGGLRHGRQRFDPEEPRLNASLLLLAVAALMVPTLAQRLNTPAAAHTDALSNACAIVLILVYAATIPFALRRQRNGAPEPAAQPQAERAGQLMGWSLKRSVTMLALGSGAAALVSDWFTAALVPATHSLGLSQTFTGLVVVAIASNAVEHAVGIRFALKAKPEYAISTTLNSPLQVALLLTPALVLFSGLVGPTKLTLVFPPLLVAALAVSALVVIAVIYDGEYTWIEGVALV
ncbi:MAG: calcium/proton exchanger, partial [Acidimicrobiales bacterium]